MEEHSTTVSSASSFKLLLACPSGLSPSQVFVDFGEAYDRVPHPDASLESSIAEIWDRRAQQNESLFNGQKFRFGGSILHPCNEGAKQGSHAVIQLGLTDYRTFVGTNLSPKWEKFLVDSEDNFFRCQHTASPLGNGAVIETSDKRVVVLKRSNNVGEFPGHFVFPGGHPELIGMSLDCKAIYAGALQLLCIVFRSNNNLQPKVFVITSQPKDAGITFHDKGSLDSDSLNKKVAQEMFDSIIREVVEEIGVPAGSLHNPVFIGISQRELNVRPTAFFFMKCALKSEEVQALYSRAEDGFESTQLHAVSGRELEEVSYNMPGCHQGGFALYKLMMEASKDI